MAKMIKSKYGLLPYGWFKAKVMNEIEQLNKPFHYQSLCETLECEDDFSITCVLDELELLGRIEASGEEQIIQPDGTEILIGLYMKSESKTS
jgi:hypothetical protein